MEIYIPKNFENLEILSSMKDMILDYSENYAESDTGSFDNYNYYKQNDSVTKFVSQCIKENSINTYLNEYTDIITYITKLFYSVKGTRKIFSYMKKYLKMDLDSWTYNSVRKLSLVINKVETTNIDTYKKSLENFLESLILFYELEVDIKDITLTVSENIEVSGYSYVKRYKEFTD